MNNLFSKDEFARIDQFHLITFAGSFSVTFASYQPDKESNASTV